MDRINAWRGSGVRSNMDPSVEIAGGAMTFLVGLFGVSMGVSLGVLVAWIGVGFLMHGMYRELSESPHTVTLNKYAQASRFS